MVVCETDVEKLRKKRQEWIECLDGDDANSITNQLRQLTWDISVFRVLRERPPLPAGDVRTETQSNSVMLSLFDRLFATSVLMALRRLVDTYRLDHEKKGVNSLVSLLGDVRDNACLLRRDVILELGPVDEVCRAHQGNGDFLADWRQSKSHIIDELFKPDDECPRKRIENWRNRLKRDFKGVDFLVNKFIAHAATSTSRHTLDLEPPSYGRLYEHHKKLCQTTIVLQRLISDTETSFLNIPVFNLWEGLSSPIIANGVIPELERCWQQLADEYDSWGNDLPSIVR